ncbi:hypothetical protein K457DRAFT_23862 [Linnemannia elongata AG-77]|uniref:Uncharacterized protein n=1 Tax=Linnemannia elongata AG-77 TaxID=1314771 RepID=A0A197JJP9_9FUNG|nr:hypothetical protein K457DRAFT_23862 [Linnemannia elongata AG-77]
MTSPSSFKTIFSRQPIGDHTNQLDPHLSSVLSPAFNKSRTRSSKPSVKAKGTTGTVTTSRQQQQQQPDRLSKYSPTTVLSADSDVNNKNSNNYNNNCNSQAPRLFSLLAPTLAPNSMSTSPASSSMLLPPTALFPALTTATTTATTPIGPKRHKVGLFSKIKRQKKHLLDDQYSTNAGTTKATTSASTSSTKGSKGAWTGPSSLFGRDSNDSTGINSRAPPLSHPHKHSQTTATITTGTHRKAGAGLQFRRIWKAKDAIDPKAISILPNNSTRNNHSSNSNYRDVLVKAVAKKSNWLSMPSSSPDSALPSVDNHYCQQQIPGQLQCQQHQQHTLLQRQRSRARFTFAVQDVFGIGRMSEMVVALFLAHDCFLCRKPLWLQCAIMLWEGVVVLVVLWAVLRVIGLAEVVVWGADDIVRGSVSLVQAVGHAIRIIFM